MRPSNSYLIINKQIVIIVKTTKKYVDVKQPDTYKTVAQKTADLISPKNLGLFITP